MTNQTPDEEEWIELLLALAEPKKTEDQSKALNENVR